MVISRLMAINEKELRENPKGGSLAIPDNIAVRYSLVEWLEFERDMRLLAASMNLKFTVNYDARRRQTTFSWSE